MQIRAAFLESSSPEVYNLQRRFYERACEAMAPLTESHSQTIFLEQACMAIVDAGTSVTQLLGQNVATSGRRVPDPRECMKQILSGAQSLPIELSADFEVRFQRFISLYDDIRHFGLAKHEIVDALDVDRLAESMTTAREVWLLVGRIRGEWAEVPDFLKGAFTVGHDERS